MLKNTIKCFDKHKFIKNLPAKKKKKKKNLPASAKDMDSILDLDDPLEKELATLSCILAWEISWIKEPGRLQSTGSQKSQTQFSNETTTKPFNRQNSTISGTRNVEKRYEKEKKRMNNKLKKILIIIIKESSS